ncbi:MAG: hypothetical protein FGM57_01585 [Candidatus Taylorbacteria bacterium]|nr:hypothetical protein [Candidatus Taylorbacteria bacterium]
MKNISFSIIVLLVLITASHVAAQASSWKPAPSNPPSNNAPAPINVGSDTQAKDGTLGLGGLAVFGRALFSGSKTYTLPAKTTHPTFMVGVNGDVGAKRYCDQYGGNCVESLTGPKVIIKNLQSCRTVIGSVVSEAAEVFCNANELRTGGGCRSHGGAYSYHNYPITSKDGSKGGWSCSSGSTGTYTEPFAVCCTVEANTLPSGTPADTAACIEPSTWTWRSGCKAK